VQGGIMEIIIAKDYDEMSGISAEIIAGEVRKKHDLTLGLATGDTPVGTYKELVKLYQKEGLDFSKITTFNFDEYIGLASALQLHCRATFVLDQEAASMLSRTEYYN
jgi:6-phosphogluconolactonase/glucosamine-6-phosphate isomerase/deaminase